MEGGGTGGAISDATGGAEGGGRGALFPIGAIPIGTPTFTPAYPGAAPAAAGVIVVVAMGIADGMVLPAMLPTYTSPYESSWSLQRPKLPSARKVQPSTSQRLPPPWDTHLLVIRSIELLEQPGSWQRRPPFIYKEKKRRRRS